MPALAREVTRITRGLTVWRAGALSSLCRPANRRAHLAQRFGSKIHHLPGVRRKHQTRLGRGNVTVGARQELNAHLLLQLFDALADSRLRAAYPLRSARKRPFFDDGEEVFELEQIH